MLTRLSSAVSKIRIDGEIIALSNCLSLQQIFVKNEESLRDDRVLDVLQKNSFLRNKKDCAEENMRSSIIANFENGEFTLLRILLTDLCNLGCRYCKVCHNIDNPIVSRTPLKNIYRAIDVLFERAEREKVIHITGGEPMIFLKEIKKIISYTRKKYSHSRYKYIIVVGTNGTLLDREATKYFKDNDIRVIVSLDGEKTANVMRIKKDGTSSFDEATRGINLLKSDDVETGISMVVGIHNIETLERHIDYVIQEFEPASLGVNFIKNTKANEKSTFLIDGSVYAEKIYSIHKKNRKKGVFLELLARKIFPFVEKKYRLYDCGASSGTTINIDSSGNLGTCKSFLCLKTKYTSSDMHTIIEDFKKRSPIYNEYCKKCAAQGICGNGCAYEAMFNEGKMIDKRACKYVVRFFNLFVRDLFELNKSKAIKAIKKDGYYIPSLSDRKKILGNVVKDKLSLKQCIGHEI